MKSFGTIFLLVYCAEGVFVALWYVVKKKLASFSLSEAILASLSLIAIDVIDRIINGEKFSSNSLSLYWHYSSSSFFSVNLLPRKNKESLHLGAVHSG